MKILIKKYISDIKINNDLNKHANSPAAIKKAEEAKLKLSKIKNLSILNK